jgi:hypothetical protein
MPVPRDATGYVSETSGRLFKSLSAAKSSARREAKAWDESVNIRRRLDGKVIFTAEPPKSKSNPRKVGIKRDVWVNAKIRVTKGGKIQAKVPASAVRRSNPTGERDSKIPCRVCGSKKIIGKSTCALCGATGKQRTGN